MVVDCKIEMVLLHCKVDCKLSGTGMFQVKCCLDNCKIYSHGDDCAMVELHIVVMYVIWCVVVGDNVIAWC